MKQSLLLLGLAILLVAVVFLADPGRASLQAAARAAAPSSAGQAPVASPAASADAAAGQLVLARCGGCHSLDRLEQNPQDAAGWTRTVRTMEQMGAQVSPQEEPEIVGYLVRHFGKH